MSTSRRTGLVLAALAIAAAAVIYLRRRPAAAPPRHRHRATTAAAETSPPPTRRAAPSSSAEARRARDAMRAKILEAMRRRNVTAASPPAPVAPRPTATAPADDPVGHYEPSYLRQVVREDMFPLVKQCYEGALQRRPELAGKLVLSFAIVGDPDVGGIVEDAELAEGTTLRDEEMETCVRESFMTLTFDKPPSGGGRVTVTYPIAFAPRDDAEPKDAGGD